MTAQYGKNHQGDRNEHLPTNHGFDAFFGNLSHQKAEEEPELPDYPKDPEFKKRLGPRGVIKSSADGLNGIDATGRERRIGRGSLRPPAQIRQKCVLTPVLGRLVV